MQITTALTDIASLAATLVAQKALRSKAMFLGHLVPLIDEAVALGIKHEAIHSAIVSSGVDMTFGYYRNTLYRLRARAAANPRPVTVQPLAKPVSAGSQEPKPETEDQLHSEFRAGDAFVVRSALKEAQAVTKTELRDVQLALERANKVVNETDFAAIGSELNRQRRLQEKLNQRDHDGEELRRSDPFFVTKALEQAKEVAKKDFRKFARQKKAD
ncbi:hypothetical protein [Caballeronia sp. SL2Y3]|uniref:hypothetical protein n=1 Tax=Caballeronia sp. SL2Y3 TaxID=2878151 RepID=UPI001FD595C7|nr:hypothetical protein [Caballeronia sp. SL2Y3]